MIELSELEVPYSFTTVWRSRVTTACDTPRNTFEYTLPGALPPCVSMLYTVKVSLLHVSLVVGREMKIDRNHGQLSHGDYQMVILKLFYASWWMGVLHADLSGKPLNELELDLKGTNTQHSGHMVNIF